MGELRAFLKYNRFGAPVFVGITRRDLKTDFIGIDDEQSYNANVAAYVNTRSQASEAHKELARQEADLQRTKNSVLSAWTHWIIPKLMRVLRRSSK